MAEVKKARIFLRRGSDADRLQTELCEGELGYSTDGTRVFVGDGTTTGGNSVGASMIFKAEGFDITTLTAVSSDGRAEVGDFVLTPASAYNVQTINADAPSSVISVSDYFGTVYTLSARDAGDGSLTWMAINSAIPFNHIVVPDNIINGDKIHGGNISGNVVFSGTVSASTLTATNVSASNVRVTGLAGTGNRPVMVDSDGDLAVATEGSGNVIAAVSFNQSGTIGYDFGTNTVELISVSDMNTYASSAIGAGSSSENIKQYESWTVATGNSTGHYLDGSNRSGIYKITFDNTINSTDNKMVEINAYNWRAFYPNEPKRNNTMSPVIDYYWASSSTTILYVVFSNALISDVDKKARGALQHLYPSSGIVDNRTKFMIKVY